MAESSAAEVFSSPEAGAAIVVGGPTLAVTAAVDAVSGGNGLGSLNPYKVGKQAAEEDQARADAAFEKAKGLQTTTEEKGSTESTTTSNQTQTTTFAPRSAEEQALLDASIANFTQQGALVDDLEARIAGRDPTQDAARSTLASVLGGQAFDLTAGEEARINRLRDADISASRSAVDELLSQRLGETSADAARRGLRGQAFTQLQGDAIGTAARELNMATLDANRTAAANAIAMPGQRAGIQANTAAGFADFADAARQQAIQNREALQDPVALQQLLDERLRGGTTTTSGTNATTGTSTGSGVTTGAGAANVLVAGLDKPSGTAGGLATTLEVLGAVAPVVGSAVGGG